MINQNFDKGSAKATIRVGDKTLQVERISEKYVKKLKGQETLEAKTDVEFSACDEIGNVEVLNGTSRQDTDKNIRKYFGSLEDFLMTSMASQLDSLTFINEGSTKRKEILAKFLDLEVFDNKFKMAKEESTDIRGALKRLEGINYAEQEKEAFLLLEESNAKLIANQERCQELEKELEQLNQSLSEVQNKIDSAPAEVIDPIKIKMEMESRNKNIKNLKEQNKHFSDDLNENKEKFVKINEFLKQFDVESYEKKLNLIDQKREELRKALQEMKQHSEKRERLYKKSDLLSEVPCGNKFPNCKFIKDAHQSVELIQVVEKTQGDCAGQINKIGEDLRGLEPGKVEVYIDKYNQVVQKKNDLSSDITNGQLSIDKNEAQLFKEKTILSGLEDKLTEYEENKEAIENLEELLAFRKDVKVKISVAKKECDSCNQENNNLFREIGSAEQNIENINKNKEDLETLRVEYAAYDLIMRCYHPNGISYNIIKNRLPLINEEVAKILTGIVDFEVFIKNEDKKLDIFIKHARFEPRPLEMGSGAEKTIASMAIRLALLTVSSLPKPDIFILDEPGTALDEDNMEGFVRIIDMVKSYFKTVMLISHLDTLKDAVDTQIVIDRKQGFAHVNI